METVQWVVGAEYDKEALARLQEALQSLGYIVRDEWQAVAGSQDIAHLEVSGPNGTLTVKTETYAGLSVEGSSSAVEQLKQRHAQIPSNPSFQRTAYGDR